MKSTAIYLRVSSKKQDTKSQEPDLYRWAEAQEGLDIKFFRDKAPGKNLERPGWQKLEQQIRMGKIAQVVVWRLDRLGRTASGLTNLFDDLQSKKVNLISLKDGLDLSTPAGRLMANVLASVAQYENEVRGERVRAGQAVARKNGKSWGGSKKGRRTRATPEKIKAIKQLKADGVPITRISKAVGLSRPTIRSVLNEVG